MIDRATAPVSFLYPRQGSDVPQRASCLLHKLTFVLPLDQEKVCMGHREEDGASLSKTEPRPPSCRGHGGQGLPAGGPSAGRSASLPGLTPLPLSADSPAGWRGLWEHLQLHPHGVQEGERKCPLGRRVPPSEWGEAHPGPTHPLSTGLHLGRRRPICSHSSQLAQFSLISSPHPTLPPGVRLWETKPGFVWPPARNRVTCQVFKTE